MGMRFEWYDEENSILIERYEGYWDVEAYIKMIDAENEMLVAHGKTTNVIVDMSGSNVFPADLVKGAMYGAKNISPWIDISVFIMPMTLMRRIVTIAVSVAPGLSDTIYFVDSVPEAAALIYDHLGVTAKAKSELE